MIGEKTGNLAIFSRSEDKPWWRQSSLARRSEFELPHAGWLIAGLAVLCLGAVTWYYIGNDIRRYMKIRAM
jgi:hypothetical protein